MNQPKENIQRKFFSNEELVLLNALHDKELKEVYCYLWVNKVNSKHPLDMIMALELVTDEKPIILSIHDTDEAIEVNNFDFDSIQHQLNEEFGDKIKIYRISASDTGMWKNCIGKKIQAVELTREDKNYYSDSILLNFGEEMRIVNASPLDGLIIDFYEKEI
jgi:hypothetical protein